MTESIGDLVEVASSNTQRRLKHMQAGVRASARMIADDLQAANVRYRSALITTTYRDGAAWDRRDISRLLTHYRKWAERRGAWVRYVWTLELTRKGRPHYHVVLFLPRGVTPPLPDKQGWWSKGCTNAQWARSPVGYISKYASKGTNGELPSGARLWGCSALGAAGRCRLLWHLAPFWLRRLIPHDEGVKRLKSWWVNATTGWSYLSPWVIDKVAGGVLTLRYRGFTLDDVFIPQFAGDLPPDPCPPPAPVKRYLRPHEF